MCAGGRKKEPETSSGKECLKWDFILLPVHCLSIELFWFDTPYYVAVLKILTCLYTICGGVNIKLFISTPDKDNLGTLVNLSSGSSDGEGTEHSDCFDHTIQDAFIHFFLTFIGISLSSIIYYCHVKACL